MKNLTYDLIKNDEKYRVLRGVYRFSLSKRADITINGYHLNSIMDTFYNMIFVIEGDIDK